MVKVGCLADGIVGSLLFIIVKTLGSNGFISGNQGWCLANDFIQCVPSSMLITKIMATGNG
jgi:hypothetical protein